MDPLDPRRPGRRLRLATAVVAGGALVGTGALTVVVAQAHPAAAETSTSSSVEQSDEQPSTSPGGVGHGTGAPHASSGAS